MKKGIYISSILVAIMLVATLVFSCGPAAAPTAPTAPTSPTAPTAPTTPTTPTTPKAPTAPVKPIVWKFTSYTHGQADLHTVAREFFAEVEEKTGGRFKVDYYWSATLVPQANEPYALRTGIAQGTIFAGGHYTVEMPLFGTQALPYISRSPRTQMVVDFMEFIKHPAIQKEMDGLNVVVISPGNAGIINLLGNKRIASAADLKGVRIAPTQVEFQKIFGQHGAVIISLVSTEFYDAVKKGIVDTVLTSPGAYLAYRMYEVTKYQSMIRATTGNSAFVVNKEAYNALPADIKAVFQEVGKKMPARAAAIHDGADAKLAEFLKEYKVEIVELPDSEIAAFRKTAKEVMWPEYITKYTKERGLPVQEVVDYYLSIQK